MKKLFLMACCAVFMASCGGSSNAYVDASTKLFEEYSSKMQKISNVDDLKECASDFKKEKAKLDMKYKDERKEFKKLLEEGDEEAKKLNDMLDNYMDQLEDMADKIAQQ